MRISLPENRDAQRNIQFRTEARPIVVRHGGIGHQWGRAFVMDNRAKTGGDPLNSDMFN